MKILYLTVDRSMRVEHHYVSFRQAVAKIADVELIEKSHIGIPLVRAVKMISSGQLQGSKVLDPQHANKFDFIFTDSMYFFWDEEWENVKVPTVQMIEEVHGSLWKRQLLTSNQKKIDLTAYRYRDGFNKNARPLLKHGKTLWLPHGVDTDICKDYGESKIYEAMHVGIVKENVYPIRHAILRQLRGKSYFRRIPRAQETFRHSKKWPIKHDYARLINQSKMCLTCGAKVQYPVMKYLEIPACNSLLIADYFSELKDMGFKDRVNMIAIDPKNIAKQVEFWLANEVEREQIARQGMELVTKRHSIDVRARELVDFLQREM